MLSSLASTTSAPRERAPARADDDARAILCLTWRRAEAESEPVDAMREVEVRGGGGATTAAASRRRDGAAATEARLRSIVFVLVVGGEKERERGEEERKGPRREDERASEREMEVR